MAGCELRNTIRIAIAKRTANQVEIGLAYEIKNLIED